MRQVLFYIPLHSLVDSLPDIPVYGYGMMLFLAFVLCSWLAGRLSRREGIDPKILPDLAIWLFVTGILGARINYVLQEWPSFFGEGKNPLRVFALWDGGLVLYGSLIGGALGYFLAHRRLIAPANISSWKMADILAPCIALGVGLGRIGCLMTGCCYGNVACAACGDGPIQAIPFTVSDHGPAIRFPLPSYPTQDMARLGYQTLAGFTVELSNLNVIAVEPNSPAAGAGLQPGDNIVAVNGKDVSSDRHEKTTDGNPDVESRYGLLNRNLLSGSSSGVRLKVQRGEQEVELPAFLPVSMWLHPTQIYETISMVLLLFLLLSFYPYKKLDGSVMVLLMVGYGIHRFLNEMLRIDNPPLALDLTFSQLVSIGVLLGAAVLAYFVFVRRDSAPPPAPVPAVNTW